MRCGRGGGWWLAWQAGTKTLEAGKLVSGVFILGDRGRCVRPFLVQRLLWWGGPSWVRVLAVFSRRPGHEYNMRCAVHPGWRHGGW
jgi:hypothetical protein